MKKTVKLILTVGLIGMVSASTLNAKGNFKGNDKIKAKKVEIFKKVKSLGLSDIDKLKSCIDSTANLKELKSCRKSSRARMKDIRNYMKSENMKLKFERKKRKANRAKMKANK